MAKKKLLMRVRMKPEDKPKAGRPAEKLSGDEVLGRRIPRGDGQYKKWWVCINWRDREQTAKEGGRLVREYQWAARCKCGARMEDNWHAYTLPPVSGHKLPAKCDACNDRATGRDRTGTLGAAVAAKPVGRSLLDDCYYPLVRGDAVNLNWDLYGRDNVVEMHGELVAEGMVIPASMSAYLGIAAEPVVEAVAEPVAPVVVEPEPEPEPYDWEAELNVQWQHVYAGFGYPQDWSGVDYRVIRGIRGRCGNNKVAVPDNLQQFLLDGGKGVNRG